MRKGARVGSVAALALFLLGMFDSPLQAATPWALEVYRETVQQVMTRDGEIGLHDRTALDAKKVELGLTDQEAAGVEDEVHTAVTTPPSNVGGPK